MTLSSVIHCIVGESDAKIGNVYMARCLSQFQGGLVLLETQMQMIQIRACNGESWMYLEANG